MKHTARWIPGALALALISGGAEAAQGDLAANQPNSPIRDVYVKTKKGPVIKLGTLIDAGVRVDFVPASGKRPAHLTLDPSAANGKALAEHGYAIYARKGKSYLRSKPGAGELNVRPGNGRPGADVKLISQRVELSFPTLAAVAHEATQRGAKPGDVIGLSRVVRSAGHLWGGAATATQQPDEQHYDYYLSLPVSRLRRVTRKGVVPLNRYEARRIADSLK